MPLLDLFLILVVAGFVFYGFFFGFIKTVGSLIGTILGLVIATRVSRPISEQIGFIFGGGGTAQIIVFIIVFLILSRLIGFVFWLLEKPLGSIKWLPFVGTADRLLGGLLGFIEGVMVVGVVIFYAFQILPEDAVEMGLAHSSVATFLRDTMIMLQFLFPADLRIVVE